MFDNSGGRIWLQKQLWNLVASCDIKTIYPCRSCFVLGGEVDKANRVMGKNCSLEDTEDVRDKKACWE